MLAVAGESVTVMKKNAPDQALKLKRQDEWKLYLEFLKVTFNLADRLSALHIPIKDQPDFMRRTGRCRDDSIACGAAAGLLVRSIKTRS